MLGATVRRICSSVPTKKAPGLESAESDQRNDCVKTALFRGNVWSWR